MPQLKPRKIRKTRKPVKILVEILHPAHVHVFRNAIQLWRERGDEVLVLSREKECANDLLDAYGIEHRSISRIGRKKLSLAAEMIVRDWRMWREAARFKPDILVGVMGVTVVQVARLLGKPAVVFYDTENAGITNRFVYPLAYAVCTPTCYQGAVRGHHVTYPGYHELAYLHPDRFAPDPKLAREAGVDPASRYFILRFVSWQASHDIGETGLTSDFKRQLVDRLLAEGRVAITSEGDLPADLEPYRLMAPPHRIHHVMAYATMLVGESATMASECAVLGVPSLFVSDTGRGYTDEEEERYGLVFNFKTDQSRQVFDKVEQLLGMDDLDTAFKERRAHLLREKIDTTSWMVDYLDHVVAETT